MGYILGVDGGGTKTHCVLFNTDGVRQDFLEWGPTNFESLENGYEGLYNELTGMFDKITGRNNIRLSDVAYGVFGLAGVDSRMRHAKISDVLTRAGMNSFTLVNDAFLGVKAGARDGSGVCAINGTGTSFAGIDPHGSLLHIGGMGRLTGDIGGGPHLGTEAVGYVYDALYKGAAPTVMQDILFDILGVEDKDDYMDVFLEKWYNGDIDLSTMNKAVFRAANMGDGPAIRILEEMGLNNARAVNACINGLDFGETVEVVLAGSIYTKGENPSALDALKRAVTEANSGKTVTFAKLTAPPVAGAAVWALEIAAGVKTPGLYETVIKQFV